jgi:predicted HAD superfamily Cof-like phosphohydrolase
MSTVTPPIEPTQIAAPLDDYLTQVVQTLHTAVNQGMRRLADNPQGATQQINDAEEMIDIIMAGDVKEWLG